jgi:hypothetical protein
LTEDRTDGAVSLRVAIEPGDPIRGIVHVDGSSDPAHFSGWIELMAMITSARAQPGADADAR